MKEKSDKSLRDMMQDKKVSPENLTPEQKEQYRRFKDKVGQYSNKDVSELMQELDKMKNNKDVSAKLKGRDLDNFTSTLKPILNREQQRRLDDIVKHLRKN
jgi:hypothetical protein